MSKLKNRKYFYLHENGELIEKPAIVVEMEGVQSYFNSPFVLKYWVASTDEDIVEIKKNASQIRLMENLKGEKYNVKKEKNNV